MPLFIFIFSLSDISTLSSLCLLSLTSSLLLTHPLFSLTWSLRRCCGPDNSWVLVWIGVEVLTFSLSWSCGGTMVWVSGGSWCRSVLEGLGFLSRGVYGGAVVWVTGGQVSIGDDGFAMGWLVVDGHRATQIKAIFFSC